MSAFLSFAAVWLATRLLGPTGYGGVIAIIAGSQEFEQGVWQVKDLKTGQAQIVVTNGVASAVRSIV